MLQGFFGRHKNASRCEQSAALLLLDEGTKQLVRRRNGRFVAFEGMLKRMLGLGEEIWALLYSGLCRFTYKNQELSSEQSREKSHLEARLVAGREIRG